MIRTGFHSFFYIKSNLKKLTYLSNHVIFAIKKFYGLQIRGLHNSILSDRFKSPAGLGFGFNFGKMTCGFVLVWVCS